MRKDINTIFLSTTLKIPLRICFSYTLHEVFDFLFCIASERFPGERHYWLVGNSKACLKRQVLIRSGIFLLSFMRFVKGDVIWSAKRVGA